MPTHYGALCQRAVMSCRNFAIMLKHKVKCEAFGPLLSVSSAVYAALCVQVEFSTSAAELPAHWNTCTGNFLRRCECPVSQV